MSYYLQKKLSSKKQSKVFTNELSSLLFAHGDVNHSDPQTIAVLEDILINYLVDICTKTLEYTNKHPSNVSKSSKYSQGGSNLPTHNRVKVEDLLFVLRNDPLKLSRANELLKLQKIIVDARKQTDFKYDDAKVLAEEYGQGAGRPKRKNSEDNADSNNGKKQKKKKLPDSKSSNNNVSGDNTDQDDDGDGFDDRS